MTGTDARSLSPQAQEDLRRRVVGAVRAGMSKSQASRVFAVSRMAIHQWMAAWREEGGKGLAAQRRGRPPRPRLDAQQARRVCRLIRDQCPDQLRLPFALWTRQAVRELLASHCGVNVSVWTAGRYLKAWGFTPQKPLRRAYEQDPQSVRRWLEHEYPAIAAQAKAEKALIYWGDEMGMRSDHQAGTSYGLKGQTPVVPGTGKRFGCNMISAITNRGELSFMIFKQRFTAAVFIVFLARLLRQVNRPVYLIVDGHPVHKAAKVSRWVEARAGRIKLIYLPGYSPELNPDEMLNNDVKTNAVGRRRARNQPEMLADVRGYLRSTQRRPEIVRGYFQEKHVRYAAA